MAGGSTESELSSLSVSEESTQGGKPEQERRVRIKKDSLGKEVNRDRSTKAERSGLQNDMGFATSAECTPEMNTAGGSDAFVTSSCAKLLAEIKNFRSYTIWRRDLTEKQLQYAATWISSFVALHRKLEGNKAKCCSTVESLEPFSGKH